MNTLLHWFTAPEWAQLVKTLLHSLWQGAVIAATLALLLRRIANPETRYRLLLAGLAALLLGSIGTWSFLNPPKAVVPVIAQPAPQPAVTLTAPVEPADKIVVTATLTQAKPKMEWTAWLALLWLLGASAMLGRASVKVAGAEQLRRTCQPLDDPRFAELVAEARRAVGLARRVRVAVTTQLTSPAVVGVLVPTLILPLSLLTTLSPEQLRFVLLHELAHIRRGDYLANLFQLFAEALFFFNPAVWWLSHQLRREREACCDAFAIKLSGAPADYARTLVSVAETMLNASSTAAPAFGNSREPSALADRVQRALVPGYRPSLRLTWRAMLAALVAGGVLLGLLAAGTRETIAAILPAATRETQNKKTTSETNALSTAVASKREVVFRFKHKPDVKLQGTASVTISERPNPVIVSNVTSLHDSLVHSFAGDNSRRDTITRELHVIQNNEVRTEIPVGARVTIEPKEIPGFWFGGLEAPLNYLITNGPAPMEIEIPAIPAAVLSVQARDADGSLAENYRLSITESNASSSVDRMIEQRFGEFTFKLVNLAHYTVEVSNKEPVLLTVPVGSLYQAIAQRGNSFCVSKLIKLSDEKKPTELKLSFGPQRKLDGLVVDATGRPVKRAEVQVTFNVSNRRIPLPPLVTDDNGRFQLANVTPNAGYYEVGIHASGLRLVGTKLDFTQPTNTIQLNKLGEMVYGQLFEEGTGKVIPDAEIRARPSRPSLFHAHARTDAEGRFRFDTLDDETYFVSVEGAEYKDLKIKGDQNPTITPPRTTTPIKLEVKLKADSRLVPVLMKTGITNNSSTGAGRPTKYGADQEESPASATQRYVANAAVRDNADAMDRQEAGTSSLPRLTGRAELESELKNIRMDEIGFDHLSLQTVVQILSARSRLRDPERRINFIIQDEPVRPVGRASTGFGLPAMPVTIEPVMRDVSLAEVLDAVVKASPRAITYTVEDYGVVIKPAETNVPPFLTRMFKVSSNVLARVVGVAGNVAPADMRKKLAEAFRRDGVDLEAPGKSLLYDAGRESIYVRATQPDLDKLEGVLGKALPPVPQVHISAHFMEFSEDANADFVLGLLEPMAYRSWDGKTPLGNGRPTTLSATNITPFTGILTESQFQVVRRALEKRFGVEILYTPQVTTVSDRQAQIRIVDTHTLAGAPTNAAHDFQFSTGPVLDIVPYVSADGASIRVVVIPTITELIGYDEPANFVPKTGSYLRPISKIPIPHFLVRQLTTEGTIGDGQTLVIGGFTTEHQTAVPNIGGGSNDLTFITGDFLGGTKAPERKPLMVFVTATLIDPAGNRINPEGSVTPSSGGSPVAPVMPAVPENKIYDRYEGPKPLPGDRAVPQYK